ncbi:MAG TPA: YHS domain-containing protein [Candidatus Dormibacteraeota bacterium]|nr:YHS domain-containing protein [Candidatus Dormibacteraeota bacterium]
MLRAMATPAAALSELARDPVCGMTVDPAGSSHRAEHDGTTYYFCSAACQSAFERNPARYTSPAIRDGHVLEAGQPSEGEEMEAKGAAIDPVCGMSVDKSTAEYRSFRDGQTYYFCSAGCKQAFDKDPEKYLSSSGEHRHH